MALLQLRQEAPIVVLRTRHASECASVVEVLMEGGVNAIEFTLTTAGVIDEFPLLRARFGDALSLGIGTIRNERDATFALDVGADFLVTPTTQIEVIGSAAERKVPILAGAFSPTEISAAWEAGATAVKVFPATAVGPQYFRDLAGPFPDVRLLPSGGVGLNDATDWLKAGAAAVSIGGPLVQDAFAGGSLLTLRDRVRELVGRLEAWRES